MYELKPLSSDNLDAALAKADRYRLLGEPREAESICEDVLAIDQDNQRALITMLLATTERFREDIGDEVAEAKAILPRLQSEHDRAYYAGIICERRAKVIFMQEPEAGPAVFSWLHKAMQWFERAEDLSDGSDDARLRWNTCARMINQHKHIRPPPGPPSGERVSDLAG
jgi:hypothetical protein